MVRRDNGEDGALARQPKEPEPRGRIWVAPRVVNNREITVGILGDGEGLQYLAGVCRYLSSLDQPAAGIPPGSREHVHLELAGALGSPSSYVELSRADASGTGEIPGWLVYESL